MGSRSFKLLLLCFILTLTVSCSRQGNTEEAWVRIGEESVQIGELMIYLLKTYNDFEEHGGEDVWLIQDFNGGKPAEELAKEGAMENLIKVKVLVKRADELGIKGDDGALKRIRTEADTYYRTLATSFVDTYKIDEAMVQQVFVENYLADEVFRQTMENYEITEEMIEGYLSKNPEYMRLSALQAEDVLTTYLVHHLVVRTHIRDDQDQWQPMSEEDQLAEEQRMKDLYERLESGEDFLQVTKEATDALYLATTPEGLTLNRAQIPLNFVTALESIEEGQYTGIIRGEYGFHVMQLLEKKVPSESDLDHYENRFTAWEDALKADAKLELTKEAFRVIYERWQTSVTIVYGQEWDALNFLEIFKEL